MSFFRKSRLSELDIDGTARCGRCAEILPDETMTYCPVCGVPFSRMPPTTGFSLLAERFEVLRRRKQLKIKTIFASCIFVLSWILSTFFISLKDQIEIRALQPFREISFYIRDSQEFPSLPRSVKHEAIAVALHAFEDHFGIALPGFQVFEDQAPEGLKAEFARPYLRDPFAPILVGALAKNSAARLSHWENDLFPSMYSGWSHDPSGKLPLLITNIPILKDPDEETQIETKHLSPQGVVSGLASPAMVVVTAFRMLTTREEFLSAKIPIRDESEKVRFLGEYLIAHELGHALLGLPDYVIENTGKDLRGPASVSNSPLAAQNADLLETCLMHTDAGGGFQAWNALRLRALGTPARCQIYENTLKAFQMRAQSIALLKLGDRENAERTHREAIGLLQENSQDWIKKSWSDEHKIFLSPFRRWLTGGLMLQ